MAVVSCTLLAIVVFVTDLLIKNHIERTGTEGQTQSVCGGRMILHKYHNKGAFLNAGERKSGLVAILSLILYSFWRRLRFGEGGC